MNINKYIMSRLLKTCGKCGSTFCPKVNKFNLCRDCYRDLFFHKVKCLKCPNIFTCGECVKSHKLLYEHSEICQTCKDKPYTHIVKCLCNKSHKCQECWDAKTLLSEHTHNGRICCEVCADFPDVEYIGSITIEVGPIITLGIEATGHCCGNDYKIPIEDDIRYLSEVFPYSLELDSIYYHKKMFPNFSKCQIESIKGLIKQSVKLYNVQGSGGEGEGSCGEGSESGEGSGVEGGGSGEF